MQWIFSQGFSLSKQMIDRQLSMCFNISGCKMLFGLQSREWKLNQMNIKLKKDRIPKHLITNFRRSNRNLLSLRWFISLSRCFKQP